MTYPFYSGRIAIDPPLSDAERSYLLAFSHSRRMRHDQGPYHVHLLPDILDPNRPPSDQPGLWCQWIPNTDGSGLQWDEVEKFHKAPEWMAYIRSHFITLGAARLIQPESQGFWTPHRMAGVIFCLGADKFMELTKIEVDDQAVWLSVGSWTEQAKSELFGLPHPGGKTSQPRKISPSYDHLLSMLTEHPECATFLPRTRIPDFCDPETAALFEHASLSSQLPASAHGPNPRSLSL